MQTFITFFSTRNTGDRSLKIKLKAPLYAQIELTPACNLSCRHCYNEPRFSRNKPKTLSKAKLQEIAGILVQNEIFSVTLTGGEPLLAEEKLKATARILKQHNLELTLNSNLTTMTEEKAKMLSDLGIEGVMTSLHSYKEETHDRITQRKGSHKRTLKAIQTLQKQGMFVSANMVVSKHNKNDIFETGNLVKRLGLRAFSSAQAIPSHSGGEAHLQHTLSKEEMIQYLEDLNRLSGIYVKLTNPLPYCLVWNERPHLRGLIQTSTCTAGRTIIQISPNGEVKPCPMINQSYGNILEEDLREIWKRAETHIPEECSPCDLSDRCRGGCRAEAERMAGTLDSRSPYASSPVKVEPYPFELKENSRMVALEGIKARKDNGAYVLFARDRYMIAPEPIARLISAISRKGLTIDKKLVSNSMALRVIEEGVNAGILKIA